jgi:hypothetical protein
MGASWAPDGTKLVFGLRPPYFELWADTLDPAISTVEALGPGQTLDEHWGQMLRLYTRRMQADPQDASPYCDRAGYYDYLHEQEKVKADMRRWSSIMSGKSPSDFQDATARNIRRVINGPFKYQFVFSAERPVNKIPLLNIAFGQKGRCNMKSFQMPILSTSLLGLCLLSGLGTPPAYADFTFGTPVYTKTGWIAPCISADGLDIYFHLGDYPSRIWTARRTTPDGEWGPAADLGPIVNGPGINATAWISPNKLELYFASDRPGSYGSGDLYVTKRATVNDDWGTPVNLGGAVNSASTDSWPNLSGDGLELYFIANRPGGYGDWDLWMASRATVNDNWGTPVNLGPTINTADRENAPCVSPDGLLLFFGSNRPGGYGGHDLYVARRTTTKDPWGTPVNLGPIVNTGSHENGPRVLTDGSMLYFISDRPGGVGGFDFWQGPITPIVDFNGDGIVDAADVVIMIEHWLTDYPLCDIGPMPWGDGIVDVQDLIVLAEHLFEESPPAQ